MCIYLVNKEMLTFGFIVIIYGLNPKKIGK